MIPTPAGYEHIERPAEFLPGDIMFFREDLPGLVLEGKKGSWIIVTIDGDQFHHIMSPWWYKEHPTYKNHPVSNNRGLLREMSVFRRLPEKTDLSLEEAFV